MQATAIQPGQERSRPVVPSGVLGMVIFTLTEMMFFAALISSFLIIKSGAMTWPPAGQPRLPVEETAFNTLFLLSSGVLLHLAGRAFSKGERKCRPLMVAAVVCGALFVCLQGYEWISLLATGLTLTSSSLGSFFYTIVGLHAVHAIIAIGALSYILRRLYADTLQPSMLWTAQVFWYFVVGVWPLLYWQVYLA